MSDGSTARRSRPDLGRRLLELEPIRHALQDPHYALIARPIDAGWYHAGFTGMMSGFNPTLHSHYYAAESELARWLADPGDIGDDPTTHERLVKELLFLAHDYLHSWAYRTLAAIAPGLVGYGPLTPDDIEEHAFFLVLSETVAVVGLDYWYLCVADVDERCDVALGVGPRTVHYRERLLPEYRRFNPALTVQDPAFFLAIMNLYCTGSIAGFSEQDLLESPALASWLIRELLISPRQREVCRDWLGHLAGVTRPTEQLEAKFPRPSSQLQGHITELALRLWDKVKTGAEQFHAPAPGVPTWRHRARAPFDFRYANISHVDPADWRTDTGEASFSFYLDQRLSRCRMPETATPSELERLREEIERIRQTCDHLQLERLLASLSPIRSPIIGDDPAPLELLFVN